MLYMTIILIALIAGILLLRIRLRLSLETEKKSLFFGLGKSGIEYDFKSKSSALFLFGFHTKDFIKEKKEKVEKPKDIKAKPKKDKSKRKRSVTDILKIIPKSSQALWNYSIGLLKSVIVEELHGDIRAGFDSPDMTGQLFGYYQAAYYAVPAVVGRINYVPVWDEAAFEASMKASVVIPLYKIFYRSIILLFSLPLREIIKITIGRKERSHDG